MTSNSNQGISGVQEVALTLPLAIDSFGSFSTSVDQQKIYADRVRTVISTAIGERVMRPRFGNAIPNRVYDTVVTLKESVNTLVEEAFTSHLPALQLVSVALLESSDLASFEIEVTYKLPNREQSTVIAGVATLGGNLPIEEVIL